MQVRGLTADEEEEEEKGEKRRERGRRRQEGGGGEKNRRAEREGRKEGTEVVVVCSWRTESKKHRRTHSLCSADSPSSYLPNAKRK